MNTKEKKKSTINSLFSWNRFLFASMKLMGTIIVEDDKYLQ